MAVKHSHYPAECDWCFLKLAQNTGVQGWNPFKQRVIYDVLVEQ